MLGVMFIYLVACLGYKDYVTCYNNEAKNENSTENPEEILNKFQQESGINIQDILDDNIKYNITNENREKLEELLNARMIFPGTKWCGPGNISSGPDDLGIFRNEDKCCRDHDQCPDFIAPGTTEYGLDNSGRYFRFSCSCDRKFYDCLQAVRSNIAKKVGVLYFNLIETKCFKEEYPIIQCLQYSNKIKDRCLGYDLDRTKPKLYQWFDEPVYE